ncbi:MAG: universal stress protein [Armatimonadetes bacterium]|nr:universal stress protein [Armatimonadota bacterium]
MPINRALVPVDGSEVSLKAARFAAQLAVKQGWEVVLLHVLEKQPMPSFAFPDGIVESALEDLRNQGKHILAQAKQVFSEAGLKVETRLVEGSAPEMIIAETEEGCCGIVVLGSTGIGRGRLSSVLFGSVAERVIRAVRVPVVLVKWDTVVD